MGTMSVWSVYLSACWPKNKPYCQHSGTFCTPYLPYFEPENHDSSHFDFDLNFQTWGIMFLTVSTRFNFRSDPKSGRTDFICGNRLTSKYLIWIWCIVSGMATKLISTNQSSPFYEPNQSQALKLIIYLTIPDYLIHYDVIHILNLSIKHYFIWPGWMP